MSVKVPAPVWYLSNGTFVNGNTYGIDNDAEVIGVVKKALPIGSFTPPIPAILPGYTPPSFPIPMLSVKDKTLGNCLLNLTLLQWQALVATTVAAPDVEKVFRCDLGNSTILDPWISYNSISGIFVASWLYNFKIDTCIINGVSPSPFEWWLTYTSVASNPRQGSLNIGGGFGSGDILAITGHIN